MAQKYTKIIEEFCKANAVQIPGGFYRHAASQLAVVNFKTSPPKLVAKTWFNKEDLAYYLTHSEESEFLKAYDFKEQCELVFQDGKIFKRGAVL
jgi:hypothetical protein